MAIGDVGILFREALSPVWNGFVSSIWGIIAAILILVLGYLIGALVATLVHWILEKTEVIKKLVHRMDLDNEVKRWDLISFVSLIVKWYIFLIFVPSAAAIVDLASVQIFLNSLIYWIPRVIFAIIIVLFGYILAEYLAHKIRKIKAKKNSLLASIAKIIVWIFIILLALEQINVAVSIAQSTFLIILAGIMLGLALAFGLGYKDDARKFLKHIGKKL